MMNRQSMRGLTAFILALLLVMAGSVQAQDSDEDSGMGELFSGDRETDEFLGDVAARLYTFIASAGDVVTITMIQADRSTLDPYLVLMDEFGAVLSMDDDSYAPVNLAAQIIDYEIEDDGRYFVLATGYSFLHQQPELDTGDSAGIDLIPLEYSIELTGAVTPDADFGDPNEAMFPAENGETLLVEITPEFPVFFATIEAAAGDVIAASALSDDLDTLLMIFGPEGERMIVNDDIGGGNFSSAVEGLEIERDGTYIVMVTVYDFIDAFSPGWDVSGEIEVTVEVF